MAKRTVELRYMTGLMRRVFRNARLRGSWDASGRSSDSWTDRPMTEVTGDDGCPAFIARIDLDEADAARTFRWGVVLDGPQGANFWGIPTEVSDVDATDRYRQFNLRPPTSEPQIEVYHFTFGSLGFGKAGPGDIARRSRRSFRPTGSWSSSSSDTKQ